MKTYLKAFRLKRFWLLLLLPAAFLLDFAARQSADFAEWYAVTIYPVYAQFFSAITGVFPFSVGEFCLIVLVLFILAYLIHGVINSFVIKRAVLRTLCGFCRFLFSSPRASRFCA